MNKENLKRTITELRERAEELKNSSDGRLIHEAEGILHAVEELNYYLKADEEITTQISIVWCDIDIRQKLKEINNWKDTQHTLSDKEIGDILDTLHQHHDCTLGMTWDTLEYTIESFINEREEK